MHEAKAEIGIMQYVDFLTEIFTNAEAVNLMPTYDAIFTFLTKKNDFPTVFSNVAI